MDASQENDEAITPTADDGAIQGEEENNVHDHDDGYGDGEHQADVTDWTFQYR